MKYFHLKLFEPHTLDMKTPVTYQMSQQVCQNDRLIVPDSNNVLNLF